MSDEIAQDEEDAEDYDLEALEHRTTARRDGDDDDDATTLVGTHRPQEDAVVFEIGDEGSDEERDDNSRRPSGERSRLVGKDRTD